jgi:hypothetical protein
VVKQDFQLCFGLQEPKNIPFHELIEGDEVCLLEQTMKRKYYFELFRNESSTYQLPVVFSQLPDVVHVWPFRSL